MSSKHRRKLCNNWKSQLRSLFLGNKRCKGRSTVKQFTTLEHLEARQLLTVDISTAVQFSSDGMNFSDTLGVTQGDDVWVRINYDNSGDMAASSAQATLTLPTGVSLVANSTTTGLTPSMGEEVTNLDPGQAGAIDEAAVWAGADLTISPQAGLYGQDVDSTSGAVEFGKTRYLNLHDCHYFNGAERFWTTADPDISGTNTKNTADGAAACAGTVGAYGNAGQELRSLDLLGNKFLNYHEIHYNFFTDHIYVDTDGTGTNTANTADAATNGAGTNGAHILHPDSHLGVFDLSGNRYLNLWECRYISGGDLISLNTLGSNTSNTPDAGPTCPATFNSYTLNDSDHLALDTLDTGRGAGFIEFKVDTSSVSGDLDFTALLSDLSGSSEFTPPTDTSTLMVALPAPPQPFTYVNDDYAGPNGTMIADADPNTPGDQAAEIGVNAFTTIQAAIDATEAGGIVYITDQPADAGFYPESLTINKDLTVTGTAGLNFGISIQSPTGDTISISSPATEVTLENFQIGSSADDGVHADGLTTLTVNNVRSDNNAGHGFHITNTTNVIFDRVSAGANDPGVFIDTAASFSDTDGVYIGNDDHGIQLIDISGNVTLTRTTLRDNDSDANNVGDGLNATDGGDSDSLAIGGDLIINGATISGNRPKTQQHHGIYVNGDVNSLSIDGSNISGNDGNGIWIDTMTNDVSVTNATFSDNRSVGLRVDTAASVTIDGSSSFTDNSNGGIFFDDVTGAVEITGATVDMNPAEGLNFNTLGSLTVESSSFSDNSTGIIGGTVTGAMRLTDVTADNNGSGGGVRIQEAGSLTIDGASSFSGSTNSGAGIDFGTVNGNVNLSGVTARLNENGGFSVREAADVTITDSDFSNNPFGRGFLIDNASGAVQLTNVTADNNVNDFGADISSAASVTIDGTNSFSNNYDGLSLGSIMGAVNISNTTVDDNASRGFGVNSADSVMIETSSFSGNQFQTGLSLGFITNDVQLTDVTASNNMGNGLDLSNAMSMTISGTSEFSGNSLTGILIQGSTTTQISGVNASMNTDWGLQHSSGDSITIDGGSTFNSNTNSGGIDLGFVNVSAHLTDVTADNNGFSGGLLVQFTDTLTVDGTSSFSRNEGSGVELGFTLGLVTLDDVVAEDNDFHGLSAGLFGSPAAITINGGSYSNNDANSDNFGDGISLNNIGGAVSTTNVTANGNDPGLYLNGATSYSDIGSTFSGNDNEGVVLLNISDTVNLDGTTIENNGTVGGTGGLRISSVDTSVTLSDVTIAGNAMDSTIETTPLLVLNTTTTDTQDTVDINETSIGGEGFLRHTRGATAMDIIGFSMIDNLEARLLGDDDTANVGPHTTTIVTIDGGSPTSTPTGDVLNFLSPANAFTLVPDAGDLEGDAATVSEAGFADVVYDDIEEFNFGQETEATLSSGILTITDINGGISNDNIELSYAGGTYTLADTGGLVLDATAIAGSTGSGTDTVTFPDTGISSIVFDTLDGDDSTTVMSVQPSLPDGFTIHDGLGTDSASINGNIDTSAGTGGTSITVSQSIHFTGGASISTSNGAITLRTDDLTLDGSLAGNSDLSIMPHSPGNSIGLGGATGLLEIDDAELANLQDGFSSITIGNPTAGDINIDTAAFNDPLTLITGGAIIDHSGTDIDMVNGDTATLAGTIAPGQSPGILAVIGDLAIADDSTFEVEIGGTSPGDNVTDHDQVDATGSVSIGNNVTLNAVDFNGFSGSVSFGDSFEIINRTGGTGTFAMLPEGAVVSNFIGSGLDAVITYLGGDGDDVVLEITNRYEFSSANYSVTESDASQTTSTVTVNRLANTSNATSVDVLLAGNTATAGIDFTAGPITVNFDVGETSKVVPIEILGDTLVEASETINLSMASFSGGGSGGRSVLTIDDNDSATISINDVSLAESGSLQFGISLSNLVDIDLTLQADTANGSARSGSDFVALSAQSVTIAEGTQTQTVSVQSLNDFISEPDETFFVNLSNLVSSGRNVSFADPQALGTIIDLPLLAIDDVTQLEGDGPTSTALVPVRLSEALTTDLTVEYVVEPGTATLDEDYLGSAGEFTIPAGDTTFELPISIVGDLEPEADETFTVVVRFLGSAGDTIAASDVRSLVTIQNDDGLAVVGVKVGSTQWTPEFKAAVDPSGKDFGYTIPTGASQLDPLPWAHIDQIQIQFNADIGDSFSSDLFGLGGYHTPDYRSHIASTIYDRNDFTVTMTLDTFLGDDQLLLVASDLLSLSSGAALDGEWTTGQTSSRSGNGMEGGNFEFRFNTLPGDVDQSGTLSSNDGFNSLRLQSKQIGDPEYFVFADIDGNGSISSNDGFYALARQTSQRLTGTPSVPAMPNAARVAIAGAVLADLTADELHVFDDESTDLVEDLATTLLKRKGFEL